MSQRQEQEGPGPGQRFVMKDHLPEQPEGRRDQTDTAHSRSPFDISDLKSIPRIRADDPPYRDWWAVSETGDR